MPKLLIVHGGAPTAVMNASLVGAIRTARADKKVTGILGARHGTGGLLQEQFLDLSNLTEQEITALRFAPASAIGTSRTALRDEDYSRMLEILKRQDIGYVLFTGGNGTMDTCARLWEICRSSGIMVGGIPKTIDNDLSGIDHAPGYGSAARFAARTMQEIAADVQALPIHVCFVEYMGRNAGWIAAASALARQTEYPAPHLLLLPEMPFNEENFLKKVSEVWQKSQGVIVAVSEGIRYADGTMVAPPIFTSGRASYYGAVSQYLVKLVIAKLGIKARCEIPGILGRSCSELVSETDREEAESLGALAARAVLQGNGGQMASLERLSNKPYQCVETLVPLTRTGLQERPMPAEFLKPYDVTDAFLEWCQPLIGTPLTAFPCWL